MASACDKNKWVFVAMAALLVPLRGDRLRCPFAGFGADGVPLSEGFVALFFETGSKHEMPKALTKSSSSSESSGHVFFEGVAFGSH